ncbi:MAG: hypothetical protein QM778_33700 [Myxococcales bacterium]
MLSNSLDWQGGRVEFWDLAFLDPAVPLLDQLADLKEDLAQVRYGTNVLLDVGWFPEFSDDGWFSVRVVVEPDWDEPLFIENHRTVDGLLACLSKATGIAVAAASG